MNTKAIKQRFAHVLDKAEHLCVQANQQYQGLLDNDKATLNHLIAGYNSLLQAQVQRYHDFHNFLDELAVLEEAARADNEKVEKDREVVSL